MKKILKRIGCLIAVPILISTIICKQLLLIPYGVAALVIGKFPFFFQLLQDKIERIKFVTSEICKGNKVDITNSTNIVSSSGKCLNFTANSYFYVK